MKNLLQGKLRNSLLLLALMGSFGVVVFSSDAPIVQVYEVNSHRSMDMEQLKARLPLSGIILIGEEHNVFTHRQIQLELIQFLHKQGKLDGIVMEMIYPDQQIHINRLYVNNTFASEDLQYLVRWHDDLWPWMQYRPIVEMAINQKIPLLYGNLTEQEKSMFRNAIHFEFIDEEQSVAIENMIANAHKNLSFKSVTFAEHARLHASVDQRMMNNALYNLRGNRVVLAGRDHIKNDTGIARLLSEKRQAHISIGIFSAGNINASMAWQPFDYVVVPHSGYPSKWYMDIKQFLYRLWS